ncbi:MAG: benzoyl-CoA reductase, subunit [Myxococcaceae bacterium]|nr:benzoyl-CoA reductase, subunit [Myxococcaceae bacterium]
MDTSIGIDLGSTTTKAVLLDSNAKIVGFGLTNTRSNYEVAARVAKAEAVADVQLSRLFGRLESEKVAHPAEVVEALRRAFRLESAAQRLTQLAARCLELARQAPDSAQTVAALTRLFDRLTAQVSDVFAPLAADRSRFFRDTVGGHFLSAAEEAANKRELSYDIAIGAWDRAIVEVENAENATDLDALLASALTRAAFPASTRATLERAWSALVADPMVIRGMVGTGYGRQRLPFPKESIRSEILCHGLGAHALFPATRTVLDIGGQDTKAIQVDGSGVVTSFQMNDRCAAGCGRYLGYIADEMNLGIHELGPLAMQATRPVRISSTCTVFAGVELRARLALGEKRENVLLGLHRAIVLRAMSLLARSGGVSEQLTFTGGVARNPAVVHELTTLIKKHYGQRTLNVHHDSIYTGALGAALFAHRGLSA